MKRLLCVLCCVAAAACGGSEEKGSNGGGDSAPNSSAGTTPASKPASQPGADPLSKPDTSFAHALERLRAMDVEGLQACMIPELRGKVLAADLEKCKARYGTVPASDFAAKIVERGDHADLYFKSGSKFATLVKTDGRWLSQNVWWAMHDDNDVEQNK